MARTARVIPLAESAATLDRELTVLRDRAHASLRTTFRAVAVALDGNDVLAEDTSVDAVADTIYALANESVYLRLIDGCAWPHERYAEWLTRVLAGVLSR